MRRPLGFAPPVLGIVALSVAIPVAAHTPPRDAPRDLIITGHTTDPPHEVIDGGALRALEGRGLTDLTSVFSGLSALEAGPGVNKLQMRGLTSGDIVVSDISEKPLVGIYLDDTPLSVQGLSPDVRVLDLERVEILRGPSGTRSGAAALSGLIRYVTAKPDQRAAWIEGEAGLEGTHAGGISDDLRVAANLPLSGHWALRGTSYMRRQSGFIDNSGLRNRTDANDYRTDQQRLAVRGAWGDRTIIDFSVTHLASKSHGLGLGFAGLGPYRTATNGPEGTRDQLTIAGMMLQHDLGWSRIFAAASYSLRSTRLQLSPEARIAYLFTSYPPYYPGLFTMPAAYDQAITNMIPAERYTIGNRIRNDTQELRLAGASGRFEWTAGLYRAHLHRSYDQDVPTEGFDALSILGLLGPYATPDGRYHSALVDHARSPDDLFTGTQSQRETELALFADASWRATTKLDATLGLRLFQVQEKFNLRFAGFYGVDPLTHRALITDKSQNSRSANPRLRLSYRAQEEAVFHIEAARGFRAGGINQPVPTALCASDLATANLAQAPPSFRPDHAWTYNAGAQLQADGGRFALNGDAFLIDWRDVQNRLFLGQCSYYVILNRGRILSRGLEFASSWQVGSRLRISADGTYVQAHAHRAISDMNALPGDRAPYFPRWIFGAGFAFRQPLPHGLFSTHLRYHYQGAQFTAFNRRLHDFSKVVLPDLGVNPAWRRIPSASIVSAALSYGTAAFRITLFGDNLTNGAKVIGILPKPAYVGTFQAGDQVSYARPRTLGVRLRVGLGASRAAPDD